MRSSVFAAAILLAACSHPAPPGPKIDPALAGMIPAGTVLMAGVRLEAIQKTPIYQKHLAHLSVGAIDRFAEQMKIDPRKDLWELLYVSNGKLNALMGRGKFSDESEPRIESKGANRFGYKGFNLIGDENTAVLLVGPTVAAIGDTPELKALVDARDQSPGPPPAMAGVLKQVSSEAHAWVAYSGGPLSLPIPATGNLSNINNIIAAVQTGSFYLDLRMGFSAVGSGTSKTEKDAQDLEGGLKALVGLGRLSTSDKRPDLQRIWDGIRITEQDRNVKIYIDQPDELVGKFLDLTAGRLPGVSGSQK
ncbi:MAG: hypothetical protein JO062_19115 [Bryobacterales bacterium]|nr:hypothetical protein [Bryobacterales bacterium]